MLKGPNDQIPDVVALDPFRGAYVAHGLAIEAVQSKGDADPFGVVACDPEAVQAPPQIGLINRYPAVMAPFVEGSAMPTQEQPMSSHDAIDALAVDRFKALLPRLPAKDRCPPTAWPSSTRSGGPGCSPPQFPLSNPGWSLQPHTLAAEHELYIVTPMPTVRSVPRPRREVLSNLRCNVGSRHEQRLPVWRCEGDFRG